MTKDVKWLVQVPGALKHFQRHPFTGFDLWYTCELTFSPVPLDQPQNCEIVSRNLKTLFLRVFSPSEACQNRDFENMIGKTINPF